MGFFALTGGSGIFSGITSDMFLTIYEDAVSGLPIVIPAVIGFLGLRKAVGFVMGLLHKA